MTSFRWDPGHVGRSNLTLSILVSLFSQGMNVTEMAAATSRECQLHVWPRFNKQELRSSDVLLPFGTSMGQI